jgi:hypothetical protein
MSAETNRNDMVVMYCHDVTFHGRFGQDPDSKHSVEVYKDRVAFSNEDIMLRVVCIDEEAARELVDTLNSTVGTIEAFTTLADL